MVVDYDDIHSFLTTVIPAIHTATPGKVCEFLFFKVYVISIYRPSYKLLKINSENSL